MLLFTCLSAIDRIAGNCLSFDGIDDYIYTDLDVQPSATPITTWEVWVKPTRLNHNEYQAILSTDDGGWDRAIWITPFTNEIIIGIGGNGWNTNAVLTENEWTHIAVVFDPGNVKCYVDGVEYLYGNVPGNQDTVFNLAIGRSSASATQFFQGEMDEIRIWSYPRTQHEILHNMHHAIERVHGSFISYLQFNETSGNTAYNCVGFNNYTLNNMTDADWIPSDIIFDQLDATGPFSGNCLDFDGVDDYVLIGDFNRIDLHPESTIELWIKPDSFSSSAGIISKNSGSLGVGYSLKLTDTAPYTGINFDGMTTGNGILHPGQWTHIAAVKYDNGGILFVNGNEVILEGTTYDASQSSNDLTIGADFSSTPTFFDGKIDEIRFWEVAKTLDEIRSGMFATSVLFEEHLLAYWQFNQVNENITFDSDGNIYGFLMNFDNSSLVNESITQQPSVITSAVTSYIQNGALIGGEVTESGFASVSSRGVCWGTDVNPTISDYHIDLGSGGGQFSSTVNGLLPSCTQYYVRAYAIDSTGTYYGQNEGFITDITGTGTQDDPYIVSSMNCLYWISYNSQAWNSGTYIEQTCDIDAYQASLWLARSGYSPIGFSWLMFEGNYDGNGHSISNLVLINENQRCGVFGETNYAVIKNLILSNIFIKGGSLSGTLVGKANNSIIENCGSNGYVEGDYYVGGLIGSTQNSQINNCWSNSYVNGDFFLGGLVGTATYTSISNSFTINTIDGSNSGGLVGLAQDSQILNNCYSASTSINNNGYYDCLIRPSFGGVVTSTNCFWVDDETSGTSSNYGTGKTMSEMQNIATFTDTLSSGLTSAWDFAYNTNNDTLNNSVWHIDPAINNGYPILSWQYNLTSLDVPVNTSVELTDTEVSITWEPVAFAQSYKVYSSNRADSGFSEDTSGTFSGTNWTAPINSSKKFYYVTAIKD